MSIEKILNKYEIEDMLLLENASQEIEELKEIAEGQCTVEKLVKLHNSTKLLFPSYLLRFASYGKVDSQESEVLNVLLETGSKTAYYELRERYGGNLSKAPDEFLVLGAQFPGGEEERNLLAENYESVISKLIDRIDRKYYFKGSEKDDLLQEAFMGFLKAVEVYKVERRTKFKDFSRYVIERHLGTLMNRSKNLRNRALNDSFSYNMPVNTNNETTFEDLLEGEAILPEDIVIKKEMYYEIKEKLTENELEVLKPYADGFTYEEIAFKLINEKEIMDLNSVDYEDVADFLKLVKFLKEDKALEEKEMETMTEIEARISVLDAYVFDGVEHYLCGYSYPEIAKEMKRRKKSVDNTIQRLRNKGYEHIGVKPRKNSEEDLFEEYDENIDYVDVSDEVLVTY